jgi:hypothetical protein
MSQSDSDVGADAIQGDKFAGDKIAGDRIIVSHHYVIDGVAVDVVAGDEVVVGDVAGSSGVAIGSGAGATVAVGGSVYITPHFKLALTHELNDLLHRIASQSDTSPDDVLRKGIALIAIVLKAQEQGFKVGVVDKDQPTAMDIDGF